MNKKNLSEKGNYASVNGLSIYYEIHGTGEPLVVLHGGLSSIGMFSKILPILAKHRKVIAIDQQGHGHTADIDRPLSFRQMADDTATLLQQLGIKKADVFGYSAGGSVALHLAAGYPELVRKLALASTVYSMDGYLPEIAKGLRHPSSDNFPPIMRKDYEKVAPNPAGWSSLVKKSGKQAVTDKGLLPDEMRSITAPALVMISDHDIILPEHAKELARLLHTKVVVIPNSDHASYVTSDTDFLLAKITKFLITNS